MKKDLLVLLAILLLAALLLSGTEFQTVEEYYLTHIDDIKPDSETVFLSIRCDTVLENTENLDPALRREELLPEDGVILATTEYVLREGDTVYGLLDRRPGTTGSSWNTKGQTKVLSAAYTLRGSTICTSIPAGRFPAGCIRSTEFFQTAAVPNMNCRTEMWWNGSTPAIWAEM